MSANLKRKGSPGLADAEEASKRRFAETPTQSSDPDTTQQPSPPPPTATTTSPALTPAADSTSTAPASDDAATTRAARFAALRARNAASRKSNLTETKSEARRSAIDPAALGALARKREIAAHKLLKADAGEDFERRRAWDWTVEESERWDERMARKAAARDGNAFADYAQEAGKVYARQVAGGIEGDREGMEARRRGYEGEKGEAIERAARSGGLEIVETGDGELIAVDRDGTWLSTADVGGGQQQHRPGKEAVERLVADIKKAEEVRMKKRRERGRADAADDGQDVTYINEKNKQFNQKLARFYNKYTAEIRESFERGTAI